MKILIENFKRVELDALFLCNKFLELTGEKVLTKILLNILLGVI